MIVFKKGSPIISEWAKNAFFHNAQFMGDQDALTRAIYLSKLPIYNLPNIYNWRPVEGNNSKALIIHWVAARGKQEILKKISYAKP